MPDYQNPRAKALHLEAVKLHEQAERAPTPAERDSLHEQATAKVREAVKIEHATR
jgi:hypothetical protein